MSRVSPLAGNLGFDGVFTDWVERWGVAPPGIQLQLPD